MLSRLLLFSLQVFVAELMKQRQNTGHSISAKIILILLLTVSELRIVRPQYRKTGTD